MSGGRKAQVFSESFIQHNTHKKGKGLNKVFNNKKRKKKKTYISQRKKNLFLKLQQENNT